MQCWTRHTWSTYNTPASFKSQCNAEPDTLEVLTTHLQVLDLSAMLNQTHLKYLQHTCKFLISVQCCTRHTWSTYNSPASFRYQCNAEPDTFELLTTHLQVLDLSAMLKQTHLKYLQHTCKCWTRHTWSTYNTPASLRSQCNAEPDTLEVLTTHLQV